MNELARELQAYLKQRGHALGTTGPGRDGVDGRPGDRTFAAALAELKRSVAPPVPPPLILPGGGITVRTALELVGHEAIVREAYLDSEGIWTWGVGVTSRSGHRVERYKDDPQSVQRCLEVYIWLLQTRYLPDVDDAFDGSPLTEAQRAAALSFHYNTGAIARASWVASVKAGRTAEARAQIMEWRKPAAIIERREKERDLFFDGRWSSDGRATIYEVSKPSYSPRWGSAKRVDIRPEIAALLDAERRAA
jgi:lysozyme